jgi:hypothetical protein
MDRRQPIELSRARASSLSPREAGLTSDPPWQARRRPRGGYRGRDVPPSPGVTILRQLAESGSPHHWRSPETGGMSGARWWVIAAVRRSPGHDREAEEWPTRHRLRRSARDMGSSPSLRRRHRRAAKLPRRCGDSLRRGLPGTQRPSRRSPASRRATSETGTRIRRAGHDCAYDELPPQLPAVQPVYRPPLASREDLNKLRQQ